MTISYGDLLGRELKLIDPSDLYKYNEEYDIYEDMTDDDDYMMDIYENAEPLRITGIIYKPQEKGSSSSTTTGVLYLPDLTSYVMNRSKSSEIVQKQLADSGINVFSGKLFDDEDDESDLDFQDMITVDEDLLAEAFVVNMDLGGLNMDESAMTDIIMKSSQAVVESIDEVTKSMVTAVSQADSAFAKGIIEGYQKIATVTVNESTAPETSPDVSAVTNVLNSQLEAIETETRQKTTEAVEARIDEVIDSLSEVTTVEEAEAYIDSLGLDEELADQLKDALYEGASEGGQGDGEGAGGSDGEDGGSGDESGDSSAPVDVSGLIAALESMKGPIARSAANNAVSSATESVRGTIDALESASTKAEADAVIDGMGLDETQASMLKSQIIKQY